MNVKFLSALTKAPPVAQRRTDDRHIRAAASTHFLNGVSQNARGDALFCASDVCIRTST
jgi:hypothetical protein